MAGCFSNKFYKVYAFAEFFYAISCLRADIQASFLGLSELLSGWLSGLVPGWLWSYPVETVLQEICNSCKCSLHDSQYLVLNLAQIPKVLQ